MSDYLRQYLQYIVNTGGPPTTAQFDDDWEPIGPAVRADMERRGLAAVTDGAIELTAAGKAALNP